MDRGAWRATVHGVANGQTRLSRHAQRGVPPGPSAALNASALILIHVVTSQPSAFFYFQSELPCFR